jgi:hypothetical protein
MASLIDIIRADRARYAAALEMWEAIVDQMPTPKGGAHEGGERTAEPAEPSDARLPVASDEGTGSG